METEVTAIDTRSLRERIAEVNATNDREKSENEAKVTRRLRGDLVEQLRERLSIDVDESAITMRDYETPIVEVEDFRFSIASEGELCALLTHAPCGKEYERLIYSISSLADRWLPYPHANDFCLKLEQERELPPTSLTTELRLIQALRDFVAENSNQPVEG